MTKIITIISLFVVSFLTAQTSYEKGMQEALELWKNNKANEAIAKFERIASVEKTNWLPSYYVALINTTQAYQYTNDKAKFKMLLEAAQKAQDNVNAIALENPEALVMQAMIHTAWIVYDPMTNGQKLYMDVLNLYSKAEKIAPNNPRVVFNKASFEKGMAAYFGQDTEPMCVQMKHSLELFVNFKPETVFHPTWGLDLAKVEVEKCN